MIEVKIKNYGEKIKSAVISGHAGGLKGKDILCAAVSGISQTALSGILFYNRDGIEYKIETGYLYIDVTDLKDERIQTILTTMIIGLKTIAKEYPDKMKMVNFTEPD